MAVEDIICLDSAKPDGTYAFLLVCFWWKMKLGKKKNLFMLIDKASHDLECNISKLDIEA